MIPSNNRKLTDPKEFAQIKMMYVTPRFQTDLPNDQLMERQAIKNRLNKNQAR